MIEMRHAQRSFGDGLIGAEIGDLRSLAGLIIPASARYSVPGADDDIIFADIVNSIGRDHQPAQ